MDEIGKNSQVEFSRFFVLTEIKDRTIERKITANKAERAALARRFNLLAISHLSAVLSIVRVVNSKLVKVTGILRAEVMQSCVVTLDPLTVMLESQIKEAYGPPSPDVQIADELLGEALSPEPFEGNGIDLGELVAQKLTLQLDPYPRKKNAKIFGSYSQEHWNNSHDRTKDSFSALTKWKQRR